MNKKCSILTIVFLLALMSVGTVSAQATPLVVDTTIPVSGEIKDAVNAWLATSAPAPYPYWAITAVDDGEETEKFVSLVALDIIDPNYKNWHVTDDDLVRWMGSIIVYADHSVEVYSDGGYADDLQVRRSGSKLAAPQFDGGGANVRFPWELSKSMMYGTRGVHDAGGGAAYAIGFKAVDFIGGSDLGSGVADDRVYAVATGQVDYHCEDAETGTDIIRTENLETGDYYIYAHVLHNETLTNNFTFTQGSIIGMLKHGTFDGNCGWATQTQNHYHLHFGFKASNGFFRMEGYTLDLASQKWTFGTNTVTTGQFLRSGGSTTPTIDWGEDSTAQSDMVTFWDLMLTGGVTLWDQLVVSNLPDHTTNTFLYALYQGISVAVRVARVMVYSNINLGHLVDALLFAAGIKAILGLAEFIMFWLKALKSLAPIIGS